MSLVEITTVSPSYAAELMRPEFGMGLQGVIAQRANVVSGILNGVDTGVWSPEAEPIAFSAKAMKGVDSKDVKTGTDLCWGNK